MCGIAGFVSFGLHGFSSERRKEILSSMSRAIARRGPDDDQIYDDGVLSFVFRRLSIIDLDGGRQPIWNEDKTIFVAVNGEIYNYKELRAELAPAHTFATLSDSEVVLHLYEEYGERAFEKLNGMYAIVLWDTNNKELVLARDRLGVKPLYYTETANGLIFASELKALLMHPDCPRDLRWPDLSQIGIQQKPDVSTYIRDIHFLAAGDYLVLSRFNDLTVQPYWRINDYTTEIESSEPPEFYLNQFTQTVEDAVTRQLMSDVPVGLFLSGGIDSSLIAAIAAKSNQKLHCFTVAERTTVASGDLQQAIRLCKDLRITLHAGYIDSAEIADRFTLADLERMVVLMESPRFDPEWLFKYELHKFAKHQVPELKVILLGQGLDEFTGGYSNMLGARSGDWNDYIEKRIAPGIKETILANYGIPERFSHSLEEEFIASLAEGTPSSYKTHMGFLVNQLQFFNLWHEDRTSSYNGLESRVPFLDHRLLEQLARIPENLHDKLFWDKNIVRESLHKYVPSYPLDKAKVPFFAIQEASSVDELVFLVARKLYTEYRERYLYCDKPIFDWQELDRIYENIVERSGNTILYSWKLIEHMVVSIFYEYCKKPESLLSLVEKPDGVLIRALTEDELNNVDDLCFSPPSHLQESIWKSDTSIRLSQDADLVAPMKNEQHTFMLVENNEITQRLTIPESDSWAADMLKHLAAVGDNGDSISSLAEKYTIEPNRLAQVSEFLRSKGFIEQI